ncbi:Cytosolic carboxypeptidase 1 [Rhizophlyctis rosea]|nr:Cytosolic carboxypeptidase 1 [Rhizophlyctis rosea]
MINRVNRQATSSLLAPLPPTVTPGPPQFPIIRILEKLAELIPLAVQSSSTSSTPNSISRSTSVTSKSDSTDDGPVQRRPSEAADTLSTNFEKINIRNGGSTGLSFSGTCPLGPIPSVRGDAAGAESERSEQCGNGVDASAISEKTTTSNGGVPIDVRRKVVKLCLDMKRVVEKEGVWMSADSHVQKILFSKSSPNVSIILKYLKIISDVDLSTNITSILLRLWTLLVNLRDHWSTTVESNDGSVDATVRSVGMIGIPNAVQRMDDLLVNVFELLGMQLLRVFCTRNENNVITIAKGGVIGIIAEMLRPSIPGQLPVGKPEVLMDLLAVLAKNKSAVEDIMRSVGIAHMLGIVKTPHSGDPIQRSSLRLIKAILDTERGRKAFAANDGLTILTNALQGIIQAAETASVPVPFTQNSVASLLVSVLRTATPTIDLPFESRYIDRVFPLDSLPAADHPTHLASQDVRESEEAEREHLASMCPELILLIGVDGVEGGGGVQEGRSIEIRHVQRMAPGGRHHVCVPKCPVDVEPMLRKSANVTRKLVFDQMQRILRPSTIENALIYDVMDDSVAAQIRNGTLLFDSRFESGNLQMAIKVSENEYDLLLQTDINSARGRHNQWFNFTIQGARSNTPYRFNIINMSKPQSQFNFGMQPVVYSRKEGTWRRVGESVSYYKNRYLKPGTPAGVHSTLSFTLTFPNDNDVYQVAYHYPYTYSDLQRQLFYIANTADTSNICRRHSLVRTVGGNDCPLLTITDFGGDALKQFPMEERKYVFLTARVHPGESNSSHIMNGVIDFLLSANPQAIELRHRCVFKIVPMLNPDGVVNGSHRCSLAGIDLNRQWQTPCRQRAPTIWWTKRLWSYLVDAGHRPLFATSTATPVARASLYSDVRTQAKQKALKPFPLILSSISPIFDINSCRFAVESSKDGTSRVVMWRELGVVNSFTLESSYCGADRGERKGLQFQIPDLERCGADFCRAILTLMALPPWSFGAREFPRSTPPPDLGLVPVAAAVATAAKSGAGGEEHPNPEDESSDDEGDDDDVT